MNERTPEHPPGEHERKPRRLQIELLLALVAGALSVASFVGVYLAGTVDLSTPEIVTSSVGIALITIGLARRLDVLAIRRRRLQVTTGPVVSTGLDAALQALRDSDDYLDRISGQLRNGVAIEPEQIQAVDLLLDHLRQQANRSERADTVVAEHLRSVADGGKPQLRRLQEHKGQPHGADEKAKFQQLLEEMRQLLRRFPTYQEES